MCTGRGAGLNMDSSSITTGGKAENMSAGASKRERVLMGACRSSLLTTHVFSVQEETRLSPESEPVGKNTLGIREDGKIRKSVC